MGRLSLSAAAIRTIKKSLVVDPASNSWVANALCSCIKVSTGVEEKTYAAPRRDGELPSRLG